MSWPTWAKLNEKGLAQYALPEVANRLRLDLNRDDALAQPDGRIKVAESIYRALIERKIHYSTPLYNPDLAEQEIRDPNTIFDGSGMGTCLDLALLYAGAAHGNQLLTLLVLLKGHALVAVSTARGRPQAKTSIRKTDEGPWVADGVLRDADTLKRLVDRGDYLMIECTGFSTSEVLPTTVPEGQGRVSGVLPFKRAVDAGREQLDQVNRKFLFALDVAVLQDVGKLAPHKPPGGDVSIQFGLTATPSKFRGLVEKFVRLYLGTEESPVPFGGRDLEIRALNAWLYGRPDDSSPAIFSGDLKSNNLLITAPAGRGKTALLVRWIEQINAEWSRIFVPVSIRAETNQALTFYQAFAARLAEILGEALPDPRADPVAHYRDKVIDYLERIGKGSHNCLVVIDGLDEARGWKMDTTVLPIEVSSRLKIVVSARELAGDNGPSNWLDRLGWTPPSSNARTLRVEPLTRDGIADVLRKMEFPIEPLSKDLDIIDELYRLTEKGDPLVLHFYVIDLLKPGSEAARFSPKDLRELKPGFGAYMKRWLDDQRTEWEATGSQIDDNLVDAILAVLSSAYGPLKLSDLEELITRVLPGNRIFSVRTVDPLRRFIVGDGIESGYALAHPKLGEFLQRDYFAGSKILRNTQAAFVTWMREVVSDLNADRRSSIQTPNYALLFYTQHLAAMPADTALELYRELLENGWRKAWEYHEGGFQGFSRDIELAARAFRAAAEKNPGRLQMPRTGLGAQIRCMLCLSSIRSIGLGATGEVLAEFLRSRTITPKQALYLAQLKEDKNRAGTIQSIIELLPADLRSEAFASAADIVKPELRFEVLLAIAPHLSVIERDKAALAALQASILFKEDIPRIIALTRLQSLLPETVWAEAAAAEAARSGSKKNGAEITTAEAARRDPKTNESEISKLISHSLSESTPDRLHLRELLEEAAHSDLSHYRMREILQTVGGLDDFLATQIIKQMAPRLSKELQCVVLDSIEQGSTANFRGELMTALVPYLADDLLAEVVRLATVLEMWNLEKPIAAASARMSGDGLNKALQDVLNVKSDYKRTEALGAIASFLPAAGVERALQHTLAMGNEYSRINALSAIAPHLSRELLQRALRWSLGLKGYHAASTVSVFAPYLPPEEIPALLREVNVETQAEILMSLAPSLPRDRLPEAVKLAAQITDVEQRGKVLAKLLPLLRDAELSTTITEAYLVAFVIGDGSFRAFAQAALLPYLDAAHTRQSIDELVNQLSKTPQRQEELAEFVYVMAPIIAFASLPNAEALTMLNLAAATARDISEPILRAIALGTVASHFSDEQGVKLMDEALDLAGRSRDATFALAVLAALRPSEEIQTALESATRQVELRAPEDNVSDLRTMKALSRIVLAITTRTTVAAMRPEIVEALNVLDSEPMEEALLTATAIILVFSPKLSASETAELIREALAALHNDVEVEMRVGALSVFASYLPTEHLLAGLTQLLDIGARSARPNVLLCLAVAQGLVNEFFNRSPSLGGNRIPGSPIARLGGSNSVIETVEAIRDVCSWWI